MTCMRGIWMAVLCWAGGAVAQPFDLVVANGRVIDPESGLDANRHVGIRGGKIVAISAEQMQGKAMIEARGLVVTPGFIDLHAHGQSLAGARMQAFDGVTTALELESGILPVADFYERAGKQGRPIHYGASAAWSFARIAALEKLTPSATLAWFQNAFK